MYPGNSQAKIDLAENTGVEMSKNAQFRAIRPSPSILSFVEDNVTSVLCKYILLRMISHIIFGHTFMMFIFFSVTRTKT